MIALNQGSARSRQFVGNTDVYMKGRLFQEPEPEGLSSLQTAMTGLAPYDVGGAGIINDDFVELSIARLARYRRSWAFYSGEHYDEPFEDNEEKSVVNFCKKIVDVAVDWFIAKGWKITCAPGNEQVAEALNAVWSNNNHIKLSERAIQYGGITGDSFLYVTLKTTDDDNPGVQLPKSEWSVSVKPLNPAHTFPVWNPDVPGEMIAVLIQYPSVSETGSGVLKSLYITPEKWTLYQDNDELKSAPNPFGKVNVVHVPNFIVADSNFGQSDINHIISLNEEYNTVTNEVRRIIKYHAEPTTIIFGAKAGDLVKGSKKVWSGLPVDAKVENLLLQSDLSATMNQLDRLERLTCALSSTPKVVFDSSGLALSNTSGLAMQMMFQPLIAKTEKRQTGFTLGVQKVNELIFVAHEKILGVNLLSLGDNPKDRNTAVEYTSPLPRDEQAELDAAVKKLSSRIWSQAEAVRRLSDTKDHRRLAIELAADDRHTLAITAETQKANLGETPNLDAAFLSSVMLSEDLEELAKSGPEETGAPAEEV
jgi:hypothetical protein